MGVLAIVALPTAACGGTARPSVPNDIDQNSRQFQAAAKACNSATQ